MRGWEVFAMVLMVCAIAAAPVLGGKWGFDGRPRPFGLLDDPTMSYGPTPTCMENGVVVGCDWYGFGDSKYPAEAETCLEVTRATLANTTLFPPGKLSPYSYYGLKPFIYNAAINASFCYYGCFDMTITTAPVGSPPSTGLAPPALVGVPAPSPPSISTTPPSISTPPPEELNTPPPPSVLVPPTPAPVDLISPPPPSLLTPDTAGSPPPPVTVTLSPPPLTPGSPRVVNLSGAGFLQPTGFMSFIISGALLLLNGLLA